MTNEEKAKMIADQCKPCTDDFYSGIKQGVLLALNAEDSIEAKTEKNLVLVGAFADYLKEYEIVVPENIFVGFFEQ